MATLAYGFYRYIAFPIFFVLLKVFWRLSPEKIRDMVLQRRDRNDPPMISPPIWVHAASGEIEYAKPVLRELKKKYPELPLLVTYYSPSALRLLQGFQFVDQVVPLPWDDPRLMRKFLDYYKPRAGLIARTDMWPTLLTMAAARKIPLLLFAATFSQKSSRRGLLRTSLSQWCFRKINTIFCVSESDAENLLKLDAGLNVVVAGDTRYDQVFERIKGIEETPLSQITPIQKPNDFVFIAGSTWPQDEEVLLAAIPELIKKNVRIILVPHEPHPEHLKKIKQELTKIGTESLLVSEAQSWPSHQVLVIDRVGVLAHFYTWGDLAFVGGSFKDKVHSVMEPLAAGLPVLVGPHHLNNREAVQFQSVRLSNQESAVRSVDTATELRDRVLFWKSQPRLKKELIARVHERTGASLQVIEWVERELRLPRT